MLLSSVIIILREVLEAALLFSILIALSKHSGFDLRWVGWSLLTGLIGAVVYAQSIGVVSDWFEGVGQEVSNSLIQLTTYFMLVFYMALQLRFNHQQTDLKYSSGLLIKIIMIIIAFLAIAREGSEIILYFFSVTHSEDHYVAVIIGMTIGACIGISVGFLFYYLLINLTSKWAMNTGMVLLIMVSAGMVSQASLLLIQADWLPSQLPIWNTTDWLSEKSATGQLLYALIGYEATPTAIQAGLYLGGLLLPVFVIIILKYNLKKNSKPAFDFQEL